MKRIVALFLALVLVGCGGSSQQAEEAVVEEATTAEESAAANNETTQVEDDPAEVEAEADMAAEPTDEPASDASAETVASEEESDSAESTSGERVYTGTDPATGLMINPDNVAPGMEFIVRGEIISANLTPQDNPEFAVKAPSGKTYRLNSQPLSEIFLTDGETQLEPFQYNRGVEIEATVMMAADAGPTDLLRSPNFTIVQAQN